MTLSPGLQTVTIVEPTSGNTGIALASVAAAKGHPLHTCFIRHVELRVVGGDSAGSTLTSGATGEKIPVIISRDSIYGGAVSSVGDTLLFRANRTDG